MTQIGLEMRLGIPIGRANNGQPQFNYLPDYTDNGYSVSFFGSETSVSIENGQSITNEFEVGDRLRQIATQGRLVVGVDDPGFMTTLSALYNSRKRFLAGFQTEMFSSDNIRKRAILLMPNAFMGMMGGNAVGIAFPPGSARVNFSSVDYNQLFRQTEKLMSGAAAAVSNAVGSVRF